MSKKHLPKEVMHESAVMAWAETTPLSEHKAREAAGVPVILPKGSRKEPLPLSRATTELRRAYPYIFDCAAYAKTHNPERIDTDEFYARFTMPYEVFLNYCLDYCDEQTQYLKEEIYKLIKGEPGKYIKVSEHTTVFAQPVVIAFKHTDLKTGKDKRITNIGQDAKVDLVQVLILKELLDGSHGYVNLPKAFYAKTRRAFEQVRTNAPLLESLDHRIAVANILEHIEQGGYHPVYLALEYIMAKKGRRATQKRYSLLELCEKCYPSLVERKNGILYAKRGKETILAFFNALQQVITQLAHEPAMDIKDIQLDPTRTEMEKEDLTFTAYFT